MEKNSKIFIAGHSGMIGSSICSRLAKEGFFNIVVKSRDELDLVNQQAVDSFFEKEKPEYVFLLAANVGGIMANKERPADFIYPNLMIEANVINASYKNDVRKLLFLACSIVYPRECEQPIKEDYLLSGKPEVTNLAHTVSKISGIVLCQSYSRQYGGNFVSCVASNIFGPNDNFSASGGHVIPSLLEKFHVARIENRDRVTLWGTGTPRRDFLYVDDLSDACLFLMEKYDSYDIVNIGSGSDITIREMSEMIGKIVGFKGKIEFDTSKPDGVSRRLLDNDKITKLGWKPKISIKEGLEKTYNWWLNTSKK